MARFLIVVFIVYIDSLVTHISGISK